MNPQALRAALRYAWAASTIYDVHAPRAFAFLGEVVEDRRHFYAIDAVERERRRYLADATALTLHDAGAGSHVSAARRRTVGDVARGSATPPRFGGYLLRLVDWLAARRVLELGTNLGIGSCYLAAGMPPDGHLVTIDADAGLAAYARTALANAAPRARAEVRVGTFVDELPGALAALGGVDLAFIDGHHDEHATVEYFTQIAGRAHAATVVVLDDIHWSAGMERAWARVCRAPGVALTVDLFRWGVVFLGDGKARPQHLTIAPWHWKPWHMGFFGSRAA